MKIRIITIHGIPNFGSVFQSYALCSFLKQNGYEDTEIIDYNPSYYEAKTLRSRIGKVLNFKAYKTRTRKFRDFVETNIPLTDNYESLDELIKNPPRADVYIAGGDQLWNVYHTCGKDDAYKLTFAKGKKISYATSMGQSDFTDNQLKELGEKIRDFSAVSVRESGSIALLDKVGIKATHCVDPVFLLEKHEYEKFLKPVNEDKYLLVYLVTPSPLLDRCIDYLSNKYGLKVILCSGFSKKCKCDKFLKDLGPDEILSYIKNAEIVLSSSFHATSFSLIFKKQFFTILPDVHTNERIEDLLRNVNLSERIITEKNDINTVLHKKIDYSEITILTDKVIDSKIFLKQSVENSN